MQFNRAIPKTNHIYHRFTNIYPKCSYFTYLQQQQSKLVVRFFHIPNDSLLQNQGENEIWSNFKNSAYKIL